MSGLWDAQLVLMQAHRHYSHVAELHSHAVWTIALWSMVWENGKHTDGPVNTWGNSLETEACASPARGPGEPLWQRIPGSHGEMARGQAQVPGPWPHGLLHRRRARRRHSKCRVQGRVSSWLGLELGVPESKRSLAVILWSIDGKSEKATQVVSGLSLWPLTMSANSLINSISQTGRNWASSVLLLYIFLKKRWNMRLLDS